MKELLEPIMIQTDRLRISVLAIGSPSNPPLILLHGNVSSNLFWRETIRAMADNYYLIAPDLRGYGQTEARPIDASRGLRDWSDDLWALCTAMRIEQPINVVGWSMGAGVAMQYMIDHPQDVSSLTLVAPMSPFGFGGTKDVEGTPCYPNYAGSGGGTANPQFVQCIAVQDRGEADENSPRNVMNRFYFRPPFRAEREIEELFVEAMLSTRTGIGYYPGSFETCQQWPGVIPGSDGINNAMSPKYVSLTAIVEAEPKCPILWIRGAEDAIVSDQSLFDFGTLGKLGLVPGWPGEDVYPPQPMVSQMRRLLQQYQEAGGVYNEIVIEEAGHAPHVEKPERFLTELRRFLSVQSTK
ncbi:alpha/beta hydrolase [Brevibacillus humidisoli]|uniref:alpha/beta fold hydrolase n=1 Tax=Brevibacillus humidisoli TaxID=2895522 RepID=UPI001E59CEDB|nr:alpha/beta hydrolase [Brevibacillus humidisoli]UFJ42554.1 alpha/beta hydrolase [Brevibacillus humidisoli]